MSLRVTGNTTVSIRVTGYDECLRALDAIQREIPRAKMDIHRDAATYFVHQAKDKVHVVTGRLGRSIKVDSITSERAIVSANTAYASIEEGRKGKRRLPPHTPHAYMQPAAIATGKVMSNLTKRRFDAVLAAHQTR